MEKMDEFKQFVRKHPTLHVYVKTNEMTWQKFYELFDLYGEEHPIWESYKSSDNNKSSTTTEGINDLFSMLKRIQIDDVKKAINGIGNVISLIQDFSNKKEEPRQEQTIYQPRAIFRKFED